MFYAIECDHFDIHQEDTFGQNALLCAAEYGRSDFVRYLLEKGARIEHEDHLSERAIKVASNLETVFVLIEYGADINGIDDDVFSELIGADPDRKLDVTKKEYFSQRYRVFGKSNPEKINNKFYSEMIKHSGNAYVARKKFKDNDWDNSVWCYERFGRSITLLDDGRVIVIAGEHEDFYHPDFCIYNDVVVFDKNKNFEIYSYPEIVFPPTDFHTATLVDNDIYIIGSLGYIDSREVGETPIYKLSLDTFKIEMVDATGDLPGWISRHSARLLDCGSIICVEGGEIWSGDECIDNAKKYFFDIDNKSWETEIQST